MPRRIAAVFLALAVLPFALKCRAMDAPAVVPVCPASALDVSALPPATSSPVPNGHLLVFEIRNIESIACEVDNPVIQLLPNLSGQDELHGATDSPDEPIGTAGFSHRTLPPGDWVHILVAWLSDRSLHRSCTEHSGLTLELTLDHRSGMPQEQAAVEVRNLRMQSCGGIYLSDYRKGRYAHDSVLPAEMLQWSHPPAGGWFAIPTQITDSQVLHNSPLLEAGSPWKRILLQKDFELRLKEPAQADNGCDYRMLRMRESDGTTVISFQNCPPETISAGQPGGVSSGLTATWEDLRLIGMLPKHAGPVTYDVLANVGSTAAPSLAEAHIDLVAHDPAPPAQAAIVNPLPACTGTQLGLASPSPVIAQPGKTLRVYEATNTSSQACSLAGVPNLNMDANLGDPCPNCVNGLFAPRPNGRIDLQPGQTAHFLVAKEFHSEDGDYWSECQPVKTVEFRASDESPSVTLPFAGGACGTLDISAWRGGGFDHDPLNLQWNKMHPAGTEPTTRIPPDCNKPELLSRGRPIMIPMGKDMAFGLSFAQHDFPAGEDVPLHIWVDNTGDAPAGVWTCMGLDYFKAHGFDLYDAYGHRLLSRREARIQELCKTNPQAAGISNLWSCTRNFPIEIPVHTCVNGDDYDFMTGLTAGYELPPGDYTVRPRKGEDAGMNACKAQPEQPFHPVPGADLTFSVIQP